jgi:proteasome lid subunit RPN8/RPN11
MKPSTLKDFTEHAITCYPEESCGLVILKGLEEEYFPALNISSDPCNSFILNPLCYANAEDRGKIISICHSHPDTDEGPSEVDKHICVESRVPWYVLTIPGLKLYRIDPIIKKSLLGIPFKYGEQDCYSFIRDYYTKYHNIELEYFCSEDGWWDRGEEFFTPSNFKRSGFIVLDPSVELQEYDLLALKIRCPVVNHVAVYTGDNSIMHHYHELSNKETYTKNWKKRTVQHLRHKSLC